MAGAEQSNNRSAKHGIMLIIEIRQERGPSGANFAQIEKPPMVLRKIKFEWMIKFWQNGLIIRYCYLTFARDNDKVKATADVCRMAALPRLRGRGGTDFRGRFFVTAFRNLFHAPNFVWLVKTGLTLSAYRVIILSASVRHNCVFSPKERQKCRNAASIFQYSPVNTAFAREGCGGVVW